MSRAEAIQAIADDLRMQRLALRLTQRQVAEGVGVSPSSVASWERGDTEMGAVSLVLLKAFYAKLRAAAEREKRAKNAAVDAVVTALLAVGKGAEAR